ncbi:transcription termination factor Rho [Desulfosarcina sp. OttesenSCG-928-A07]|nr:transcription termination factor Rho [Desulfosarcina sp. OttesenSCG-928-G17]MDL2328450.1 transcription termination factor Rho [Desulfosarcina sp. OttesenSCG-928-A07]
MKTPDPNRKSEKLTSGHLEILDKGFGFLRQIHKNYQPCPTDTFVPASLISALGLREGIWIKGRGKPGGPNQTNLRLTAVDRISDLTLSQYERLCPLHTGVSINPDQRLDMRTGPLDLTGQVLNLMVPMGRGQRGLVISPPKSGKTTLLRHMAAAITHNYPEMDVFVLLVNERPEEVTDFKRGLQNAHVLSSSADQPLSHHIRITRLAISTAIRCAEAGKDVVVFIDSLTRMARAFNAETDSHGRTLSGGLGANAMEIPRKIFGTARNIENGGSVTIIASILVDTGSRMDEVIYQEFKGTGNMDLVLSRECAENRVFPAIDIPKSGTRKEEQLLDPETLKQAHGMRQALAGKPPTPAMMDLLDYLTAHPVKFP